MTNASWYYDEKQVKQVVKSGEHRNAIGGMWDEIGSLQYNFLREQGLRPEHKLLDVGCGCLRGGVRFADYLEAENYYGIDLNQTLLNAGLEEIENANLADKVPAKNLCQTAMFDATSFAQTFDYALAISVFTHIPLNDMRICMEMLSKVVKINGSFYPSIWLAPDNHPSYEPITHKPDNIITYGNADSYHYKIKDLEFIIKDLPWQLEFIGNFNHPRGQQIARFIRL